MDRKQLKAKYAPANIFTFDLDFGVLISYTFFSYTLCQNMSVCVYKDLFKYYIHILIRSSRTANHKPKVENRCQQKSN